MSEVPHLHPTGDHEEVAGRVLAEMYARRGRSLYGLCRMMLRDPHEAEDALQSTFLAAHRALRNGSVPRDEAAWLATIARNECRGRIQERMRRPMTAETSELEGVVDSARTPEELLGDERVGKALAALPENQREAVVLHDVFGLRAREVGAALGMSVTAVEAVLFRARRQLRMRLKPIGASALSLPLGVQEALTLQVPGFSAGGASAAGTAAVGAGILAKMLAAPTVVKVATGAAALATAGSVVAVEASKEPSKRGQVPGVVVSSGTAGARTDSGDGDAGRAELATAGIGRASDDGTPDERGGKGTSGRRDGEDDRSDDRSGRGGGDDGRSDQPGTEGGGDDGPVGASGSTGTGGKEVTADDRGSKQGGGGDDASGGNRGPGSGEDGSSSEVEPESEPEDGDSGGSGSGKKGTDKTSGTSGETETDVETESAPVETTDDPDDGSSSGSGPGGSSDDSGGSGQSGGSGSSGSGGSGSDDGSEDDD